MTSPQLFQDSEELSSPVNTRKRTPEDFIFGEEVGEGSFSTVVLATEKSTNFVFAIKILDKRHIVKEKKVKYVNIEKEVLNRLRHPFIIRLYYTFQDSKNFALDYAKNGELLQYIRRLGSFDVPCTKFYCAEILLAIEYCHSKNVIHRDIKPENILLDERMHIKLTDFGTAKMLEESDDGRANSFVGTAEYVPPELLTDKSVTKSADIWAWACILYQMLGGRPPFKGATEYLTFDKIRHIRYSFPDGFPEDAKDLITKILVLDPMERLGSRDQEEYISIRSHPFFFDINWDTIIQSNPPALLPYLPAVGNQEELRSSCKVEDTESDCYESPMPISPMDGNRQKLLDAQELNSKCHPLLNFNELILMEGIVYKRKGLFSKKRILVLTDKPRLLYIEPDKMVIKGEIPWSIHMQAELKNTHHFFVHTPKRTYYLEDINANAQGWVDRINELLRSTQK